MSHDGLMKQITSDHMRDPWLIKLNKPTQPQPKMINQPQLALYLRYIAYSHIP